MRRLWNRLQVSPTWELEAQMAYFASYIVLMTSNVASPLQNSRSPFRIIHVYLYTLLLKIDVMVLKSFLHKTPEDWCNAKLSQWHFMSLNKIANHTTYNFVILMKITHINIYSKITIHRKLNMTKVMPFCITKQHSACPCDWVSNWKGIDFQ